MWKLSRLWGEHASGAIFPSRNLPLSHTIYSACLSYVLGLSSFLSASLSVSLIACSSQAFWIHLRLTLITSLSFDIEQMVSAIILEENLSAHYNESSSSFNRGGKDRITVRSWIFQISRQRVCYHSFDNESGIRRELFVKGFPVERVLFLLLTRYLAGTLSGRNPLATLRNMWRH